MGLMRLIGGRKQNIRGLGRGQAIKYREEGGRLEATHTRSMRALWAGLGSIAGLRAGPSFGQVGNKSSGGQAWLGSWSRRL